MLLLDEIDSSCEKDIYANLFGDLDQQSAAKLSPSLFKQLGCHQLDPDWLQCRVLVSPPNDKHPHWLYVSAGLSLVTEPAQERYELLLEVPNPATWPVTLLQHLMAEQLLAQTHGAANQLPIGEPIAQHLSEEIPGVMLLQPLHYHRDIELPHGQTSLLQVVGITAEEWLFAKHRSAQALVEQFTTKQGHYVTRLHRQSVV